MRARKRKKEEKFEDAYYSLAAKSSSVLTRKDLRNIIAKKAIMGEISIPNLKLKGRSFLMG